MSISCRPAVREDVLRVLVNMSDATALDLKALGTDPVETLGFFAARVPETDAVAFVEREEPIAVFGWDKVPARNEWFSWILTTPAALSSDPAFVFAARDHLRALAQRQPEIDFQSALSVDTAPVRRWMRCLGFVRLVSSGPRVWRYVG